MVAFSPPLRAERDLTAPQSTSWTGHQLALLGGLSIANLGALTLGPPATAAASSFFIGHEERINTNYSPVTTRISDIGLVTSLLLPVATTATHGQQAWANAMLVYAETIEASLLMNTMVKRLVRRARPYVHGPYRDDLMRAAGSDAYYSFYSGHTALSFSSAVAGSLLFDHLSAEETASAAHYASSMAIAAFTGAARVRAGRHYPSDVAVGFLLGVAWGCAVPAMHGLRLDLSPLEAVSAVAGTSLGFLTGSLLPNRLGKALTRLQPSLIVGSHGAFLSFKWTGTLQSDL